MKHFLENLSNQELLAHLHALIQRGRVIEADLLIHLGEVDARRLYLAEGFSCMFLYCVRVFHFSEAAAYKRIRAARVARRHPEILAALRRGDLHVTSVSLLAAQLTDTNCGEWIQLAKHRTADEIKRLLADRQPKPPVADCLRRIPEPTMSAPISTPTQWALPALAPAKSESTAKAPALPCPGTKITATVPLSVRTKPEVPPTVPATTPTEPEISPAPLSRSEPLGNERYRVYFTADGALHAQLKELRALLHHQIPDGDLGKILGRAVALLLCEVRKRKFGEVSAPRSETPAKEAPRSTPTPASRSIPAAIRRAVSQRDEKRCSYISPQGRRCGAQDFLEFHHLAPWARTRTHSVDGIALRCRAHNQYHARRDFGEEHMARFWKA